jgi:hypothetical protein
MFNIPPDKVFEKFNSLIEPIFDKIKINSKEIKVLEKTRDALLPKLMSGEIRVREKQGKKNRTYGTNRTNRTKKNHSPVSYVSHESYESQNY